MIGLVYLLYFLSVGYPYHVSVYVNILIFCVFFTILKPSIFLTFFLLSWCMTCSSFGVVYLWAVLYSGSGSVDLSFESISLTFFLVSLMMVMQKLTVSFISFPMYSSWMLYHSVMTFSLWLPMVGSRLNFRPLDVNLFLRHFSRNSLFDLSCRFLFLIWS